MDQTLKQRLVGATVLIALAVIFLPVFLSGPSETGNREPDDFFIPSEPPVAQTDAPTRRLPVLPSSGRLGLPAEADNTSTPSVERISPLPEATIENTVADVDDASNSDTVKPERVDDLLAQVDTHVANTPTLNEAQQALETAAPEITEPADRPVARAAEPVASAAAVVENGTAVTADDWRLQVVTLGNADNIQRLRQQLTAAGINNTQERIDRSGQVLYRILTGPYASRAGAQAAISDIQVMDNRLQPQILKPTNENGAVKPATAVVDSDDGLQRFAVQTGVFSAAENANTVVNRLTGAGYAAYSERVSNGANSLHRVRIGPLLTQDDADTMAAEILTNLNIRGIVVAYP